MANDHFFPGDHFSAAPFLADSHAPPLLSAAAAMASFGWVDHHHLPADSSAHFDSALSSLVSSPVSANAAGGGRGLSHGGGGGEDEVAIGDLIGRLGSICNGGASADTSCYSTPLSSPPRGPPLPAFRGHAGDTGRLSRVASSKSLGGGGVTLHTAFSENSQAPAEMRRPKTAGAGNPATPPPPASSRKRKAPAKETQMQTAAATTSASTERRKVAGGGGGEQTEEEEKVEPGRDYIHVRARRGQATDSHSLAERVRRERISQRMKLLQSLVPGCNKVTGKALMLDEIINYVQSLQRQVEFLSMKLSTMNPELDFVGHRVPSKDVSERITPADYPSGDQGLFSVTDMFAVEQGVELENNFRWEQELRNMVQMGGASSSQTTQVDDPNALYRK